MPAPVMELNMNIPLPPGSGHATYLEAMERLVLPALAAFRPDAIIVASGYDAAALDPLGRMLATADTFRQLTELAMDAADELCDGRLTLVHEGGYSELYVPFCGHAVLQQLSGSTITAPIPSRKPLQPASPTRASSVICPASLTISKTTSSTDIGMRPAGVFQNRRNKPCINCPQISPRGAHRGAGEARGAIP